MVFIHANYPKTFWYDNKLTTAQILVLQVDVKRKNRLEMKQTPISNLYFCLGNLERTRYSRVPDAMEVYFEKEQNKIYEIFQLLATEQNIGESVEQFYSFLCGLAVWCNFGILKTRILKDVSSVNMSNRKAQHKLCRSNKTPEELFRITLSKSGGKIRQDLHNNSRGAMLNGLIRGRLQTKTEPVEAIRGGYRISGQRTRGRTHRGSANG